jgi:MerR family transcriptional regulator, redox-sensitive transcriptional activator SoxR
MTAQTDPVPTDDADAPAATEWLPIGVFARRAGLAASALRFYEAQGLLTGRRSDGGQRRYPRAALRRVAFIRAAQSVGLSLEQIQAALATLPGGRTPTPSEWARLSRSWRPALDARIAELTQLRDRLDACIGCGCLSLKKCALYNPRDAAGADGPGARFLSASGANRSKPASGRS